MYQADPNRYHIQPYNRLGNSGLMLPTISLGLWHNFGSLTPTSKMQELLTFAFDKGVTHFDLANNYGPPYGEAERNFGLLFKKLFRPYRDELIISTKAGYDMWEGPYGNFGSRKYLIASLDQSLKRLGLEYVDIFYHHRMDPKTSLEETMGALDSIVKQGKALYVGLSNYDGPTLEKATLILKELHTPFVICQNRYSLLDRTIEKNGLKEMAAKLQKGIIAFSPLAQGLLSDKYLNSIPEDSRLKVDPRYLHQDYLEKNHAKIVSLNEVAKKRGQSLASMALSWVLRDGKVASVLVGLSKKEQLKDNLKALENLNFSEEELLEIDKILN